MLIYLASSYSHVDPNIRKQRYEKVLEITAKLIIEQGLIVYSPIVHNHPVVLLHENRTEDCAFEFWRKFDSKMLSRCDQMWILTIDGWNTSTGIREEMKIAESLAIQIRFVNTQGELQ